MSLTRQDLKAFLSQYIEANDDLVEKILPYTKKKSVSRGNFLLRQGQRCKEFVLITKGCTRLFYIANEIEYTVWFGFPDNVGSEIQSFISGEPSKFFVEAIEDLEYLSMHQSSYHKLMELVPAWHLFVRKLWEDTVVHIIDRIMAFQSQSATERYLDLIRDPDYLQMIPQKYLASYLGVTRTSLSRLRRKIATERR